MEKRRKSHRGLKIVGIVILVFILLSVISSAKDTNKSVDKSLNTTNKSTDSQTDKPQQPPVAKIGVPARDGKFEFTVKSVECGKATVGANQYLTKTAQGQYCLLNMSVKNIGNEPQTMFSMNQYLYNKTGQKYESDSTATIYNDPSGGATFTSSVNPGNSASAALVFDIPKDQAPVTAELHDSAFSAGVKVSSVINSSC